MKIGAATAPKDRNAKRLVVSVTLPNAAARRVIALSNVPESHPWRIPTVSPSPPIQLMAQSWPRRKAKR